MKYYVYNTKPNKANPHYKEYDTPALAVEAFNKLELEDELHYVAIGVTENGRGIDILYKTKKTDIVWSEDYKQVSIEFKGEAIFGREALMQEMKVKA